MSAPRRRAKKTRKRKKTGARKKAGGKQSKKKTGRKQAKKTSKKKTKKKTAGKKSKSKAKTARKKTASKKTASTRRKAAGPTQVTLVSVAQPSSSRAAATSAALASARPRPVSRRLASLVPPRLRRLKGLGLGVLLGVVLLACVREQKPATLPPPVTPSEPEIRVRLFERTLARSAEATVILNGSWGLRGESDKPVGIVALRPSTLEVSVSGGAVEIKGQEPLGSWLLLTPNDPDATFTINERTYLGALRIEPTSSGGLEATNILGLESYLLGVVSYESPLGWLDEALYSQAIAARTYALVSLKPQRDYDVVDDTRDQVYRGLDKPKHRARVRKLVEGTRGRVVTYKGKPITTYFHSTCGGDTVPAMWIFPWAHEAFEPWSGASDCPCQASKYYRWEQPRELGKGLNADAQSPAQALVLDLPLTDARVEHHPRGGYAKTLVLTDQSGEPTRIKAWEARRVFGLRGYAFDVSLSPGGMGLEFSGRGWGHGVGMCQFGAQGRAKQGWKHPQILANYYPGTKLTTLPFAK